MSKILEYKEKVKQVIEAHGGKVAIDFIPGIITQPDGLRDDSQKDRLFRDVFEPVKFVFNGVELFVMTVYQSSLTPAQITKFIECLQLAKTIMEEIEK